MYVYSKYYKATKVALVYPGSESFSKRGKYFEEGTKEVGDAECSVLTLGVHNEVKAWQKEIASYVFKWSEFDE